MRLQRQRKAHGREGGAAPQAKGTKKRQSQGQPLPYKDKGDRSYVQVLKLANKSREEEREDRPIPE